MTSRSGTCHRSTTVHPKFSQLKRLVRCILQEGGDLKVSEILNSVRSRCPHWAVTYRCVRKVLDITQREKEEEGEAANCRLFPRDLVESRQGQRKSRRCWRGQVYRVPEIADSDSEEELASGYCKVSWLPEDLKSVGAMGYSTSTCKVSSLKLIDRPFGIGDRVARVQDPESLGQVIQVKSKLLFASRESTPYPEVPASAVRPVGGFRTEDLVAHEQTRWVGRVAEGLYNVEVEVRKRGCSSPSRPLGRCLFQVCSEGHSVLDPVEKGPNQTAWQEMSPHFTGQKVEAGAKVWRQAEWLTEMPKWILKSFNGYKTVEGTVTKVELQMLGVRWCDSWGKDIMGHSVPAEWVAPSTVTRLELPESPSEGWSLGEHAQAALAGVGPNQALGAVDPSGPSGILTKISTHVTVKWADSTVEDSPSTQLVPRQDFYSHDFLPGEYVARSTDADKAFIPETLQYTAGVQPASRSQALSEAEQNLFDDPFEPPPQGYQEYGSDVFRNFLGQVQQHEDILPINIVPRRQNHFRVPVGQVQHVNLKARTAVVQWRCSHRESPQEVSLFELAPHPYMELRLGDIVFIPPYLIAEAGHWVGRVVQFQTFTVLVALGNGQTRPFDLDVLRVGVCDLGEAESTAQASHQQTTVDLEETNEDLEDCYSFGQEPEDAGELDSYELESPPDGDDTCGHSESAEAEDSQMSQAGQMQSGGSSSSTSRPEAILPLDTFDEDHEPLDHKFLDRPSPAPKVLMRAVKREMTVLRKGLLDGAEGVVAPILVRTYASRSDLFRAMVVGPPGTPYADVPFFFDLAITPQYPAEPPRVYYLPQFASSSERLNPNLYCDGKVCLSLLGTWAGPGWDPNSSTLLQVLVSLQGLVLVEEPYFNEPGHESDAKSEHGRKASELYNENVRLLCLRAALNIDKQPPRGFEEVVARHFFVHGPKLLAQCEEDVNGHGSEGYRQVLARSILPSSRERWGKK